MAKEMLRTTGGGGRTCIGDRERGAPVEARVAARDIYTVLAGLCPGNPRDLKLYTDRLEKNCLDVEDMNHGVWTRKQVEDMVVAANIRGLSPAGFDDLADWLQRRLNTEYIDDSSSDISTSTTSTCPGTPLTSISDYSEYPDRPPLKAKAEDEASIQGRSRGSVEDHGPSSNSCRRRPPTTVRNTRPPPRSASNQSRDTQHAQDNPSHTGSNISTPRLSSSPPSITGNPKLRPTVHFSERAPPKLHHQTPPSPSSAASSADQSLETSVIDRQWGKLFTGDGEPTTRLLQVLRGLASYINNESPKSLVITPDKLYAFYKRFRLDKEHYSFQRIFSSDSRKSLRNLEILYQDLRCEYHLVQGNDLGEHPYIPALTPYGFASWLVSFIQATPSHEARRLSHVIATLPIDAVGSESGSKPERLPKQLSRHLFPPKPLRDMEKRVDHALMGWAEEMSPSNSSSSSWSSILRGVISQSPSPDSRGGDTREQGARRYRNTDREAYVEVPASHSSRSSHRPSRPYHQTRDHSERLVRHSNNTYVEKASRRTRDTSPRRPGLYRERSPRPSKHRDGEPRRHHRSSLVEPATSPSAREGSTEMTAERANNYAFFQGRDPGKTYEEFDSLRETSAARRPERAARYDG